MHRLDPTQITVPEVFSLLQGGIAPRPIALVSTMSATGERNLSPFSFFNAFGGNPPIVAFSPSRRQRDDSLKDTYRNLTATGECTIQIVTHAMVQQVSLASTEYPSGTDEFIKSGLTPVASEMVKPPRVAESPFQMECRLQQMIPLGDGHGSGNLAICRVLLFHVAEELLVNGVIAPDRLDSVARNGGDYYTRAAGAALFQVRKPLRTRGIGFDQLPGFISSSPIFSKNHLAQLANIERIPTEDVVTEFAASHAPLEGSLPEFRRLQDSHEFQPMFRLARYLHGKGHADPLNLYLLTSVAALECDNLEFAWHAALFGYAACRQNR